jgi:hypothetical protein
MRIYSIYVIIFAPNKINAYKEKRQYKDSAFLDYEKK